MSYIFLRILSLADDCRYLNKSAFVTESSILPRASKTSSSQTNGIEERHRGASCPTSGQSMSHAAHCSLSYAPYRPLPAPCEMCVLERASLSTKSRTRDKCTITTTFRMPQHAMHTLHACRTCIYRVCSASPELTPSYLCLTGTFTP